MCLLNDILKMDWKYNQLLRSRYIPCESLFLEAILNLNKIRIFQLLNTFEHFGSPLQELITLVLSNVKFDLIYDIVINKAVEPLHLSFVLTEIKNYISNLNYRAR